MIANSDEVMAMLSKMFSHALEHKSYGSYGVIMTMHNGEPAKLLEVNEIKFKRCPGNKVSVVEPENTTDDAAGEKKEFDIELWR